MYTTDNMSRYEKDLRRKKQANAQLGSSIRSLVSGYLENSPIKDPSETEKLFTTKINNVSISGSRKPEKFDKLIATFPDGVSTVLFAWDPKNSRGEGSAHFLLTDDPTKLDSEKHSSFIDYPFTDNLFAERVKAIWPQIDLYTREKLVFDFFRSKRKTEVDKVVRQIESLRNKGFLGDEGYTTVLDDSNDFVVSDQYGRIVARSHGLVTSNIQYSLTNYDDSGTVINETFVTHVGERTRNFSSAFDSINKNKIVRESSLSGLPEPEIPTSASGRLAIAVDAFNPYF